MKNFRILTIKSSAALSLIEVLIALGIAGILGTVGMKSLAYIKTQNIATQHFLLKESSLFETQIFINKYLEIANRDSLIIQSNSIEWESYTGLFKAGDNNGVMEFDLTTKHFILEIIGDTLYFNNNILLSNAKILESRIYSINNDRVLEYKLCDVVKCINDFVILSDSEINL